MGCIDPFGQGQVHLETLETITEQVGEFALAIARMANDPAMDVGHITCDALAIIDSCSHSMRMTVPAATAREFSRQPDCLTNGRFPDSNETTRVARQNKDMKCPGIPSGNHGVVNRTHDEFRDTDRC